MVNRLSAQAIVPFTPQADIELVMRASPFDAACETLANILIRIIPKHRQPFRRQVLRADFRAINVCGSRVISDDDGGGRDDLSCKQIRYVVKEDGSTCPQSMFEVPALVLSFIRNDLLWTNTLCTGNPRLEGR